MLKCSILLHRPKKWCSMPLRQVITPPEYLNVLQPYISIEEINTMAEPIIQARAALPSCHCMLL